MDCPYVMPLEPGGGGSAVLGTLNATENKTYLAEDYEVDGWDQVNVNVPIPEPILIAQTFTENGEYLATNYDADGFSSVEVTVPAPTLITKNITANGDYSASTDNADGYSEVTVAVPSLLPIYGFTETVTEVVAGANSVTNAQMLREYFIGAHKFIIAKQKGNPTLQQNEFAFFASDTGTNTQTTWGGYRYRNGELAQASMLSAYDALLVEGSVWEVHLYDLI